MIRASKTTTTRYEHDHPGSLAHTDVTKIGRIPDGGGRKFHGRQMGSTAARTKTRIGYDYVHTLADDHSRYADTQILPDETAATTASLARALDTFAHAGIQVERLMSDNHWSYSHSHDVAHVLGDRGITHVFIRPHYPRQNGKGEHFNRTPQTEWAYRQPFRNNQERADALAPMARALHH